MESFKRLESKTVVLPLDNVDTDQIVPARFLTVTTRDGMGANLFADWRNDPDFVLNQPASDGAAILVAGENFGCGSSREHAPWALVDYGFRAVVSTSIADIFKNNAVKNGLLPVEIDAETQRELLKSPGASLVIDLEQKTLSLPDGRVVTFPIDGFARHCLLDGVDQLDFLMQRAEAIRAFEASHL